MFTTRRSSTSAGLKQVGSSAVSAVAVIALIGVLLTMFGQRADRVAEIEAVAAGSQREVAAQQTLPDGGAPLPVAPSPEDRMGAVPGPLVPRGSVQPEAGTAEAKLAEPVDVNGRFTDEQLAAAPRADVVLFNQTLDAQKAEGLRTALAAAGWTVKAVDRWNGAVPATTVYYPKGMELEARALMAAFPSIGRIKPAFGGIPTDKLTVIVCKDLPALR
ncbi:MAG: LytR C-terminal domain-containing protein [Sporichthyaceae bacterium]